MASFFLSPSLSFFSTNPRISLLRNPNPKPLRSFSSPLNPNPNPRLVLRPLSAAHRDEWGEKSDPEPESPAEPDPPTNEDKWGKEKRVGLRVTDEWGEESEPEPEPEAASQADPPMDDDEWGGGGEERLLSVNGSPVPPAVAEDDDDRLGDLKRMLVDTIYGTDYGLTASAEVRAEVFELVSQLEAENPTPAPTEAPEKLEGNWILLYTAFSELLPLIAVGSIPLVKVKQISQAIDTKAMTIINATSLSTPLATFSFSATASFEVRSPSRIQVKFKEGAFQPPEISSTVGLPGNIEIFGQKIDLVPVQQSLTPLQDAVANIARTISGQPPLKVPIPGNGAESWLLTTYLDEDFRISRGDGGLFVLAKEGSPLLDQLS
ncbi:putative plastid-lipid-associated protein 3, chloroplastic [Iris pallida]|uniref:Plastid-lipid-associated protein 3, chloroplastic n=1 Tax=Iris pallida TaxID=29817 RepID=A0AAX6GZY4_IRIPA|nr:putative plastid-lipid-associated protein 3, chloroplastic [Iris pallida]